MRRLLDIVSPDSPLDIRQRVYQLMCLIGAFFSLVVVTPGNILEHLPLPLIIGVIVFGLFFVLFFYLAHFRGLYPYTITAVIVLSLVNFAWFFNAGSEGPVSMILFSASIALTVFLRGWTRGFLVLLLTANMFLLYYLDARYPALITPYPNPAARLQDFFITIPSAISICVLMVMAVIASYDAERERLAKAREDLETTLREIRTLKGLLPICSHCKKIRTDKGDWTQLEVYISQNSEAEFTHGMCPSCFDMYLADDIQPRPLPRRSIG